MLFSSPVFLFLFLPATLIIYFLTGQKNIVLLTLSLLFYAWGEPVLVLVMIATIAVNYLLGLVLSWLRDRNHQSATIALALGLAANLGLLAAFKYLDFFIELLNPLLAWAGLQPLPRQGIPLPLGISFFTFQAMSYLIDIYRRECDAQRDVIKFALFKALFPQLIAGPIVRYTELVQQLSQRVASVPLFAEGVRQFIVGLAKKVLIADVVAVPVDHIFQLSGGQLSATVAWAGAFLFMIQIYFDFSGYTDMAIGISKMLGFRLPPNFNYPYAALSIQDFWRRWHMTLSRWFRDYLYIPLGGSRNGPARTNLNLLIVFLLCGLWHGASVTFIVWGLYHGFFLIVERTRVGHRMEQAPIALRRVYVLTVLLFGWMMFRAQSLEQVSEFAWAMVGLNGWSNSLYPLRLYADSLTLLAAIAGTIASFPVAAWLAEHWNGARWSTRLGHVKGYAATLVTTDVAVLATMLLVSIAFVGAQTHRPFIYFRF